jgi:hypothetical protein
MSCALGDDSRLPDVGDHGLKKARDWMKGWEEGVLHVFNRIADGVSVEEARREVQIILDMHRDGSPGLRRPQRKRRR